MAPKGSTKVPLAKIKDPKTHWTAWTKYIVLLRYFHLYAENAFGKLGAAVARNPKKTISFSLLGVALCSLGLINLQIEKRSVKLFVPENSLAENALKSGKPFFSNSLNTRTEDIIFTPKSGSNVLSAQNLQEISQIVKETQSISRYRELCKERPTFVNNTNIRNETCSLINPIEILNGNITSKDTIFTQFQTALSSTSYVMSNGRSAVFNLKRLVSGFRLDANSKQASATAVRVMFLMKHGETKAQQDAILEWEKSFIKKMTEAEKGLKYSKMSYAAERSLDDSINESSSSDIPLISITFTVMITFACLTLAKFVNPVRGHSWLAQAGVFSTAFGILAGIGITIGIGIPFISLVGVVPFLVVSIGIDDMFIICDEFDRQSKDICPKYRVSLALSKVGATITMTTVTDIVAFFVSATSAFPAIRYFCIFMAFCISIEFLLQITLFVAFLSFDSLRIYNNRMDLLPCRQVEDHSCSSVSKEEPLSSKIMRRYAKLLLKWPIKILVILMTLGLLGFGIYGTMHVRNEFSRQNLALKDSYYSKYLTASEGYFSQNIPVNIQITERVNYSDPVIRKETAKLGNLAYDTGYYLQRSFNWVESFENHTQTYNIPSDGLNFKTAIKQFLNEPAYSQHRLDVILNNQGDVIASRVVVFTKNINTAIFQKDAMLKIRSKLSSQSKLKVSVAANEFIYFEQYAVVIREIIISLVSVTIVILIILIPFCIHPIVIMSILCTFVALILELLGLMYFWGVDLSVISLINLVMAVGFSVDYSAHVAQAFVSSREKTVNKRIIEALSTIGGSVLFGGLSTFLGMSLTGFAASKIFQIFFKMFVGIILFALFNGLALLPVLLSIFSKCISMKTGIKLKIRRGIFGSSTRKGKTKIEPINGRATSRKNPGISILGMSTKVPTAKNYNELWDILINGKETISQYPEQRKFLNEHFSYRFNPSRPVSGRHYVSKGSYLEQIDAFDHMFFGISATEAKSMDPQQRMLLQGTYEAIEDSGMKLEELQQCCTGVFVGMMNLDFGSIILSSDEKLLDMDQFTVTGTSLSIAANRISFALNLTGPSLVVDTACSSSVTALSIACDHLQKRVIDVAIVAAANLILCPRKHMPICRANMLASDGKCKVFDERADGYGRGEAIIAFVLKASDLVNAKFDPHGEILNWGINNDGQYAAPINAPSVEGQVEVMSNVLQQANVSSNDVQYIEMHGTGTVIGDMVETRSVGEVYGKARAAETPMLIGSVKSNINHTESAASLAGLAKVCLMMKHNTIVPTTGIGDFAARLSIEEKGLKVQTEPCDWPEVTGKPKVAAINSFGFGGSNGHLLIREPNRFTQQSRCLEKDPVKLYVLSARSKQALLKTAESFSTWMKSFEDTNENQTNVCYSLNERRTDHGVRIALTAKSLSEAAETLHHFSEHPEDRQTNICSGKVSKNCSKIAFVFGGQGSQWSGMAGDLLKKQEIREEITKIDNQARKRGHRQSLLTYLAKDDAPNGKETVQKFKEANQDHLITEQLSIFALQYSVAKFLSNCASIIPVGATGHSLGDITAACVAGIISSKEAVKIIIARASLQNQCMLKGAMAAVGLPTSETKEILQQLEISDKVCISAENDAKNVTISGDAEAIDKFEEHIQRERKDVFWRQLQTSKAFHSHHMDVVRKPFTDRIEQANIRPKINQTTFYSTTEGKKIHGTEMERDYWWRNMRNAVLFDPCVKDMLTDGIRVFIEISPRPVLSHYLNSIGQSSEFEDFTVIQGLPKKNEEMRLHHLYAQCIGKMYTLGYPVTMDLIQNQRDGVFVRYPQYSWQETIIESMESNDIPNKTCSLLGVPKILNTSNIEWINELDLYQFGFIRDHEMNSAGVIIPGSLYVEQALEAALGTNFDQILVRDLVFHNILPMSDDLVRKIRCSKSDAEDVQDFKVFCETDQGDMILATAKLTTFNKKSAQESLTLSEALNPAESVAKTTASKERSNDSTNTSLDVNDILNARGFKNGANNQFLEENSSDSSSGVGTSASVSPSSSLGEGIHQVSKPLKESKLKDSLQKASLQSDCSLSQNDSTRNSQSLILNDSLKNDSLDSAFTSAHTSSNDLLVSSLPQTNPHIEDLRVLKSVGLSDNAEELTADEFHVLALDTGFTFGETFSLIERAWHTEKKGIVRLSLPNSIEKELGKYIIHPCIIDACMQARIPLGKKGATTIKKLPVGIKEVRLRHISKKFKYLYCYAELSEETEEICDAKLMDDNGNVIMYLQGFKVQDVTRAQRYPLFDGSIYEMNWKRDETLDQKQTGLRDGLEFIVVSLLKNTFKDKLQEALSLLGVPQNRIYVQEVAEPDMTVNFVEEIERHLKCKQEKNVIIINLMPTSAYQIAPDVTQSSMAHWLCFESTLELLKLLSHEGMSKCKLLTFTCQSIGYDIFDQAGYNLPWAATTLGLGRVSFLESDIPVISFDISKDAIKDDFVKALVSIDMPAIEEGCIVSSSGVYRPKFERLSLKQMSLTKRSLDSVQENFYLSWSEANETYCIKGSPTERIPLTDDFVDVRVSHVSTPAGQCIELLRSVKSRKSSKLQQIAVGNIIATSNNQSEFKIGDDVIAVLNSKWIKDRLRLPTTNVFRKPEFLTPEEAAVLPGCLALANNILVRITTVRQATRTIFIAPTKSNHGMCWALSQVARNAGLEVIFRETTGTQNFSFSKDSADTKLSQNEEKSRAEKGYDCVICSSELHPVDNITLLNTIKQDGILVIIDTENKESSKSYNFQSPVTIIYEKPYMAQSSSKQFLASMRHCVGNLEPCSLKDLQAPKCVKIADVCKLGNVEKLVEETVQFNCLKVRLDEDKWLSLHPASMDLQGLKDDRSYVVIGGTKGLGLETVKWMASRGAGTIMTVGRSTVTAETKAEFDKLQTTYNVKIKCVQADVGTKKGIEILEKELEKVGRLAGIVNSAVVLDDKLFADVDRENYTKVMGPKVNGTLLLQNMLERKQEDLDFFILYSSIVSLIGNAGQATYAAANAFLNSFAEYRMKVLRKPCTAVCWGAMGGAGLLQRNDKVAKMLEQTGMFLLDIPTGLQWMEKVITAAPQKSNVCICDIDWQTFRHRITNVDSKHISYSTILQELPEVSTSVDGELLSLISKEGSREKQREILQAYVTGWLANWIKGSEEEIDCNVALFTYGIDSVGASVLKGKIESDLQVVLEGFYLMQPSTTADQLASDLLVKILDKLNANEIEEIVPTIDQMIPEETLSIARIEGQEEEDTLILPDEYLSPIYISNEENAIFFIVHPSHRYAGVFQPLGIGMQFQKIFSLYAFGSQDAAYQGEDVGSVRRLAKACVSMMLEKQPHGPYFLGGYSFGALVSLEMATILQNAGKEVALLVMIDTLTWISKERNNLELFFEMFESQDIIDETIQEQMQAFFTRIATTNLKIKPAEYQQIAAEKSIEELERYLRERAENMSIEIPDIHAILQSTSYDQRMSSRCHEQWAPPKDMYKGPVLYIKAEDEKFCTALPVIGTNADCWRSIVPGDFTVVTLLGNHFSMMDASRAPDVGNHIAVHATLRYRSLFPSIGRAPRNACHKDSFTAFKDSGMQVCFVTQQGSKAASKRGIIKLSSSSMKLEFNSDSALERRIKIKFADVVHISKENLSASSERSQKADTIFGIYAGICLQLKRKRRKYKIRCSNRQDYKKLVNLLEAIYCLKLPL